MKGGMKTIVPELTGKLFFLLLLLTWISSPSLSFKIKLTKGRGLVERDQQIGAQLFDVVNLIRSYPWINITEVDIFNYLEERYYGPVQVGRPLQYFNWMFDTTSPVSWTVIEDGNPDCCFCLTRTQYKRSRRVHSLDKNFTFTYGTTGTVQGYLLYDVLKFCDRYIPVFELGAAQNVIGDFFRGVQWDGILGLGLQSKSVSSVIYRMFKQRKTLWEYPVFSFYFYPLKDARGLPDNGIFEYGAVDYDSFLGLKIDYAEKLEDSNYWAVEFKSIKCGGLEICSECSMILDTGAKYIYGPHDQITKLNRLIGAKFNNGYFFADCDRNDYPNLTISIYDDVFVFTPQNYIVKTFIKDASFCITAFMTDRIHPDEEEDVWTLGVYFMQSFYVVFDAENNTVGFARPNNERYKVLN